MNKISLRQYTNLVAVIVTIIFNGLANALPLNGLNTGQISDRFQVYFVPAGYVFSIWGLIYIGWLAFAIYQFLPAQRDNPRLQRIGYLFALSSVANMAWLFCWHYEQFILTVVVMLTLLGLLIAIYLRLQIGCLRPAPRELWCVDIPFSVYLGWITVATVANITEVLDYLKWNGFGLAPELWMGIVLVVVLVIAARVIIPRRDVAYGLVILWALAGISLKFGDVPAVSIPTWITFILVALILGIAQVRGTKVLKR